MKERVVKMKCPNCGAEMNHHADKVVYGVDRQTEDSNAPGSEAVLEESHTCPGCGSPASRLTSTVF
jgi:ribosomal protein S27AE